jgi:hypothetical protein
VASGFAWWSFSADPTLRIKEYLFKGIEIEPMPTDDHLLFV